MNTEVEEVKCWKSFDDFSVNINIVHNASDYSGPFLYKYIKKRNTAW